MTHNSTCDETPAVCRVLPAHVIKRKREKSHSGKALEEASINEVKNSIFFNDNKTYISIRMSSDWAYASVLRFDTSTRLLWPAPGLLPERDRLWDSSRLVIALPTRRKRKKASEKLSWMCVILGWKNSTVTASHCHARACMCVHVCVYVYLYIYKHGRMGDVRYGVA